MNNVSKWKHNSSKTTLRMDNTLHCGMAILWVFRYPSVYGFDLPQIVGTQVVGIRRFPAAGAPNEVWYYNKWEI